MKHLLTFNDKNKWKSEELRLIYQTVGGAEMPQAENVEATEDQPNNPLIPEEQDLQDAMEAIKERPPIDVANNPEESAIDPAKRADKGSREGAKAITTAEAEALKTAGEQLDDPSSILERPEIVPHGESEAPAPKVEDELGEISEDLGEVVGKTPTAEDHPEEAGVDKASPLDIFLTPEEIDGMPEEQKEILESIASSLLDGLNLLTSDEDKEYMKNTVKNIMEKIKEIEFTENYSDQCNNVIAETFQMNEKSQNISKKITEAQLNQTEEKDENTQNPNTTPPEGRFGGASVPDLDESIELITRTVDGKEDGEELPLKQQENLEKMAKWLLRGEKYLDNDVDRALLEGAVKPILEKLKKLPPTTKLRKYMQEARKLMQEAMEADPKLRELSQKMAQKKSSEQASEFGEELGKIASALRDMINSFREAFGLPPLGKGKESKNTDNKSEVNDANKNAPKESTAETNVRDEINDKGLTKLRTDTAKSINQNRNKIKDLNSKIDDSDNEAGILRREIAILKTQISNNPDNETFKQNLIEKERKQAGIPKEIEDINEQISKIETRIEDLEKKQKDIDKIEEEQKDKKDEINKSIKLNLTKLNNSDYSGIGDVKKLEDIYSTMSVKFENADKLIMEIKDLAGTDFYKEITNLHGGETDKLGIETDRKVVDADAFLLVIDSLADSVLEKIETRFDEGGKLLDENGAIKTDIKNEYSLEKNGIKTYYAFNTSGEWQWHKEGKAYSAIDSNQYDERDGDPKKADAEKQANDIAEMLDEINKK